MRQRPNGLRHRRGGYARLLDIIAQIYAKRALHPRGEAPSGRSPRTRSVTGWKLYWAGLRNTLALGIPSLDSQPIGIICFLINFHANLGQYSK